MGLMLVFKGPPSCWSADGAYDGLTALMDMNVFNRDLLLAAAAELGEGFELSQESAL